MPRGLRRFYGSHDMHFITCSRFRRRPLLDCSSRRAFFLETLEELRQSYEFVVAAYVVMPEHFHLLASEPERDDLSRVMQVLKQRVARRLIPQIRRTGQHAAHEGFWQRRFYDFNVWSAAKHAEKVRYIHDNPVRRGLVAEPQQWEWSSYRAYAYHQPGIVVINAPGSAKLKVRSPAA
jgi:putative transposase